MDVKLKAGDTVWFVTYGGERNNTCLGVKPHTIDAIHTEYTTGINKLVPTHFYEYDIGESIFLNKEDADRYFDKIMGKGK